MKKTLLVIAAITTLFYACKKDDSSSPGTVYNNNSKPVTPPPVGFSFPYTYSIVSRSSEFKIWIKGADVTSHYTSNAIFPEAEMYPDFQIKLLDKNLAQLTDPSGVHPPSTANYFFSRDTFYVMSDNPIVDTIPFGIGNYSGFTLWNSSYLVAGSNNAGGKISIRSGDLIPLTYQILTGERADGIMDFDTVAYFNTSVSLK